MQEGGRENLAIIPSLLLSYLKVWENADASGNLHDIGSLKPTVGEQKRERGRRKSMCGMKDISLFYSWKIFLHNG